MLLDNSYFVTSIPYDKGFTIKVDNKVISYEKVDKAFVGFPITKGKHDISIVYTAPGLKYGLIFSITGFIIYGMVIIMEHKKSKKLQIKLQFFSIIRNNDCLYSVIN